MSGGQGNGNGNGEDKDDRNRKSIETLNMILRKKMRKRVILKTLLNLKSPHNN